MGKIWSFSIALGVALAIAPLAQADQFDYVFSSNVGLNGTLSLVGSDLGSGNFDITSGTLSVQGYGTYNVFANPSPGNSFLSPSGAFIVDDVLYPNAAAGELLNSNGLLFTDPGGTEWNLWGNGPGSLYTLYESTPGIGYTVSADQTISLAPVPEPGSLVLLGSGLALLACGFWRKVQKPAESAVNSLHAV